MSFHPLMVYDRSTSTSRSARGSTKGAPFVFTPRAPRRRSTRSADEVSARPASESAVLAALYLVQEQQGYLTANGMRHVAGDPAT